MDQFKIDSSSGTEKVKETDIIDSAVKKISNIGTDTSDGIYVHNSIYSDDNASIGNNQSLNGRSRRRKNSSVGAGLKRALLVLSAIMAAVTFAAAAFSYCTGGSLFSTVSTEIGDTVHKLLASAGLYVPEDTNVSGNAEDEDVLHERSTAADSNIQNIERPAEGNDASVDPASGTGKGTAGSDTADDADYDDIGSQNDTAEQQRQDRLTALSAGGYHEIAQSDPDSITISFAGDILFDEHYAVMASMLERSGSSVPDISTAFDGVLLNEMRGADIFMINNEFPYSDRGEALKNKQFTFCARPQYAALLNDIGVDIAALANNHINDYGPDAMTDTFAALQDAGIPYVGAGMNIEEASRPVYFTNGDVKIAVIAATQIERMANPDTVGAGENSPGVFRCMSETELKRLTDSIADAKSDGCFVIVYVHWGTEGTEKIDSWQIEQGKAIADAGADIIIGDHPHVLQGLDYIGERKVPVIYSLGNYLFNSKTLDTCLFKLRLNARNAAIEDISIVPAVQSGCRTTAASAADTKRILTHLQELSPNAVIDTETGSVSLK